MINKNIFTKTLSAAAVVAGLSAIQVAEAANWLMLQGTERPGAAGRAKVWGFVQAQYQSDSSDPFVHPGTGEDLWVPPKLIGPNLESQAQFNVNRARLGVRGIGMPLDSSVNYFLLAEFGHNGITGNDNDAAVSDASITVNTDVTRIRMGLFKTPGPEEALQAIHVFDYINFTSVSNQLMLERFQSAGDNNPSAPYPVELELGTAGGINNFEAPVGAFRDTGIQFFDSFKSGKWDTSYAIMIGNGNGLNFGDNDDNKDVYTYVSSELSFGGKGPRAQGLKFFAWNQSGTRTNPLDTTQEQDRKRSGVGVKYLKKPFRATFEYMSGEGMIFMGQHRPRHIFNDHEASGYYADFGYYIPNSKWEIDLRVDSYTREENHPGSAQDDESTFDTTTIAAQYHINKKTRVTIEHSNRTFESETVQVNNQLEGVGARTAVQLTHIF